MHSNCGEGMSLVCRFHMAILMAVLLVSGCKTASKEEEQINRVQFLYLDALRTQDSDKLASFYMPDAVYLDLTSKDTVDGRDDINAYFKKQFQQGEKFEIAPTTESVKFPATGKAVVRGVLDLTYKSGIKEPIAFTAEYSHVDNKWLLSKWTQIDIEPPPSHFEHLKGLNWLVGHWVNNDEDLVFSNTYRWDKNKNFIIQEYALVVLGHKQLTGEQVIGWDPRTNKIRSWIFDSDGGFGESTWSQDGDTWYVNAVYTLSDGRRSSATQIFTKVDATTYTFSSVGRDLDGRVLPDIGPFKVVREG